MSYVAPPTRCVHLADLAAELGGACVLRAAAGVIRYSGSTVVGDGAVRAYFADHAETEFEPEWMATLPWARVFSDGVVLSADGTRLARDVSPDFGKGFDEHWMLGYSKIRPPVPLPPGPVAVVAAHLGRGYCHWLLDELPRLLAWAEQGVGGTSLLAHSGADYARLAHARLGVGGKVVAVGRATHFVGGPVIVPSWVGRPGFPRPETARRLRDFTAELGRGAATAGERIYVTRDRAGRRRVANEAELWEGLVARGFARVRLEDLTWEEQIATFRRAREVVAPHGAGLANLVFSAPGARVVELFNRAYVNPCYWRLAAVVGLDYRPVVARGDGPIKEGRAAKGADIDVSLGAVVAALGD